MPQDVSAGFLDHAIMILRDDVVVRIDAMFNEREDCGLAAAEEACKASDKAFAALCALLCALPDAQRHGRKISVHVERA